MDWLLLIALGIMWVAFLFPTGRRGEKAHHSVGDHERRMELLAQAETNGTEGRWIVTPRKGMRFMGRAERTRARTRERRRQVFTFLLEAIALTFLIGLVPPLRVLWGISGGFAALLVVYVWLLLTVKHRAATARTTADPRERARAAHAPATRAAAATKRYVAEGRSVWARPTFNGLGSVGEGDRVHVVVRTAGDLAGV